jgi:putative oxidoreductase
MDRLAFLAPYEGRLLSVLRIVTGLLYFEHGLMKLFHFPPSPMFANLQLMSLVGLAGVLELVGGFLILIGLFTGPVAFILSGEMAFAYFMVHIKQSIYPALNGGEAAILFCFVFLFLAAAGGGPWSVDAAMKKA